MGFTNRSRERAVINHAVRAAAVVEGFDEDGLSCVCAFMVLADGHDQNRPKENYASFANRAATIQTTASLLIRVGIALHGDGKVQRFKLREQLRAQAARSGEHLISFEGNCP